VIALITQVVLKQMREEIQHVSKSKEVKVVIILRLSLLQNEAFNYLRITNNVINVIGSSE
jgi:hypothetical protein